MRLDKYLANAGLGSRKTVKEYIKKGWISVNAQVIKSDKFQVNEQADQVCFMEDAVHYQEYYYYLLYKPAGVISATQDKYEETVVDLLADVDYRPDLFPVGRLDKDTEGLLLLTNDGQMAHDLLSPKKHVEKEYYAEVKGIMTVQDVDAFANGLIIDGGEITLPAQLTICSVDKAASVSTIRLVLTEGKFHQVKRMVAAAGKEVRYLKRLRMGALYLDEALNPGEYRPLTDGELEALKKRQPSL